MRFRTENTIFERSQALVGDFELERVDKLGRVIQNGDVCDVDGTHVPKSQNESATTFAKRPNLTLGWISFIDQHRNPRATLTSTGDP